MIKRTCLCHPATLVLALVALALVTITLISPPARALGQQSEENRVYLPLLHVPDLDPKATVRFSDAVDTNSQLVNPRSAFTNITRLYWNVQVSNAAGKRVRVTVSFNGSPQGTDVDEVVVTDSYSHINNLSGCTSVGVCVRLRPVTLQLRVFVDNVLVSTSTAFVF